MGPTGNIASEGANSTVVSNEQPTEVAVAVRTNNHDAVMKET
jgi:hypothetical protein